MAVPENCALIRCEPTALNDVVVQVAWPLLVLTGWAVHPEIAPPASEKATVPPSGVGLTVAVKVVAWPGGEGLLEEATVVLVPVCAKTGLAPVTVPITRVPTSATRQAHASDIGIRRPTPARATCRLMLESPQPRNQDEALPPAQLAASCLAIAS